MKPFFLLIALIYITTGYSQDMSKLKIANIIGKVSDSVQEQNGIYKFIYKDVVLFCVTDESVNRMRIISPIIELFKLSEDELKNALVANFHTALDVKYAISDDILWSVYIHPLKQLSKQQVEDAIVQVYKAKINFGSSYSSTDLIFPGSLQQAPEDQDDKPDQKTKF